MKYSDFLKKIHFRFYRPSSRLRGFSEITKLLRFINVSFEILNTSLPQEAILERSGLKTLCKIPRMSTYAIGAMINYGVSRMQPGTCFVNVGVWHGFTLLAGMIGNDNKKCIGVDNFSSFGGPQAQFRERFNRYKGTNHYFYEKDCVEYFSESHNDPIGFFLYDGNHSYKNQLLALQTAEPFFSKNCIIMIDDTNWEEPRQATLDFVANRSNKYQILRDTRTYSNRHPTLWNGIMIIQCVNEVQAGQTV